MKIEHGKVWVMVDELDDGIVLTLGGGKSHIGAIATSRGECVELDDHKEGPLALKFAKAVSEKLGRPVVCVAGIHYDNATKEDIDQILKDADALLEELLERI
ncbi:MAG: hypothetical protein J7K68_00385 [Candidatus Diapherotrites archaeon]|nr:hypothetical protein [Candidatus Diapherotrites archaeon]